MSKLKEVIGFKDLELNYEKLVMERNILIYELKSMIFNNYDIDNLRLIEKKISDIDFYIRLNRRGIMTTYF